MAELAQDVNKLARKAYPGVDGGLRDTLTEDASIDALNDGDMEWFVRQGQSSAPDRALQLALEYEASQNGRQHRYGHKAVIRVQVESNYGNQLDAHLSGEADEIVVRIAKLILNYSVTPAAKHENGACFICGSPTHFKRECQNRKYKSERAWVGKCNHSGILGYTGYIEKKPQVSSTGPGNEN